MEGHLRGILGTMTVEEIYREREQFADKVMQTAAPEFESMGMEIVSFVIQDVTDDVGYLESLGKTAIADMKKDADVGTAVATRDVKIRVRARAAAGKRCGVQALWATAAVWPNLGRRPQSQAPAGHAYMCVGRRGAAANGRGHAHL